MTLTRGNASRMGPLPGAVEAREQRLRPRAPGAEHAALAAVALVLDREQALIPLRRQRRHERVEAVSRTGRRRLHAVLPPCPLEEALDRARAPDGLQVHVVRARAELARD